MKPVVTGLALVFGTFALVACGDNEAAEGPAMLTRVVAEAPGKNCPAGGQAFQLGSDVNGTGSLQDDEVKSTSFICNGTSAKVDVSTIPLGDPRCPNGGTALAVAGANEVVACNGANGAAGANGAQGAQGLQGDAGAQGAAGDQTVLGQFLASQVVRGAVLTCATTSTAAANVGCQGMKLNGVDVRLAPAEANAICAGITGKGYITANGAGVVAGPYMVWASNAWSLQPTGNTSPMNNLSCTK